MGALLRQVLADLDVSMVGRSLVSGPALPCVSPEIVGGGVNTTLFSSNRAAWLDPTLGAGKFRPDHVANYVELSLSSLSFQPSEKPPAVDKEADLTYYVRASLNGIAVSSEALHRAKPSWSQVLPHHLVDPNMLRFEGSRFYPVLVGWSRVSRNMPGKRLRSVPAGQKLLLPLPAGCWGHEERRKLKIEAGLDLIK